MGAEEFTCAGALGRLDKFHEFADVGRAIELRANLFEGLRSVELGAQQQANALSIVSRRSRSKPWRSSPTCLRHSNGSRVR